MNSCCPLFLVLSFKLLVFFLQEAEEEEEEEEEESPRRRRSIQESLSLPVPVCFPANGQKDDPGEAKDGFRGRAELSSSPSASLGDSIESSGSPLASPKEAVSPPSSLGFMRNAKKRESKGKAKEVKGQSGKALQMPTEPLRRLQ